MGKLVAPFTDYSAGENRITNFCGWVMKIIYENDPNSFARIIESLSGQDISINPIFSQQSKEGDSIPDLLIRQQGFHIWFETKVTDWYYGSQIEKHLRNLYNKAGTTDKKMLVLFCGQDIDAAKLVETENLAKELNITLTKTTFEEFVEIIRLEAKNKDTYLQNIVAELEDWLMSKGHLSDNFFENTLEVINCSGSISNVRETCVYWSGTIETFTFGNS